jgi:putative endonuclease
MKNEKQQCFFTYVIFSDKIHKYYIGSTSNLEKRLEEHNNGKSISTRNKGPWKLVFSKTHSNRYSATQMEKLIKSYKGGNAFKNLIIIN